MNQRLILLFFVPFMRFGVPRPAAVFTDGTVLQQNEPMRIWGTAEPKESVTVRFAGQEKTAPTGSDGKWMVTLDPMQAFAEPRTMTFKSSSDSLQSSIGNVLVGEVWLAGGQSNMQTEMAFYKATVRMDIDSANDPLLRMVTIPRLEYSGENNDQPQWKSATPEAVPGFSATAYYFAKELRSALHVPVGVVTCCIGGTPAEAWMSRETLNSNDDLRRIWAAYEAHVDAYRAEMDEFMSWVEEYVPGTAMAVMADGGEEDDIHPHSKPIAGNRLALLARNMVYGETNLVCREPQLRQVVNKDGAIELSFQEPDLVLIAGGGGEFELCGKDGMFHPAKARRTAEGKLIVTSKDVSVPEYVRYGWKKCFIPTLYNKAGLPASPFLSDGLFAVTEVARYLSQ